MTDKPIMEEITQLKEEARRSGKLIKRLISKSKIQEESLDLMAHPLMGLAPDEFILEISPMTSLLVGDLRKRCKSAGNNAQAQQFLKNTKLFGEDVVCTVRTDQLNEVIRAGDSKKPTKP